MADEPYSYHLIFGWLARFEIRFNDHRLFALDGGWEAETVVRALNDAFRRGRASKSGIGTLRSLASPVHAEEPNI